MIKGENTGSVRKISKMYSPDLSTHRYPVMSTHRVFRMKFSGLYPLYINKAEKKGKTKADVDLLLRWLTGYSDEDLERLANDTTDLETFIREAPNPNPHRDLIKGVICGIRVEEIEDPLMRELRYMDKLIDELARGKKMESILRKPS